MKALPYCSLLALMLLCLPTVHAQYTLRQQYDYNYDVQAGLQLDVENKYGKVVVQTWDQPKVALQIDLEVNGRTEAKAKKLREGIDFEITHLANFIKIKTLTNANSSMMYSIIEDVLPEQDMHINFVLQIPRTTQLKLSNRYGPVFLEQLTGRVDLTLANGDLHATHLAGSTSLNLRYGNATITRADNASLNLSYGELVLNEGGNLNLITRSVKVRIQQAERLQLDSRRDSYTIEKSNYLSGTCAFSDLTLRSLGLEMDATHSMGSLTLSCAPTMRSLQLSCKGTSLYLDLPPGRSYRTTMRSVNGQVKYQREAGNLQAVKSGEKMEIATITGTLGSGAAAGSITIQAETSTINILP